MRVPISFVFVCEPRKLEHKAIVLAASFRQRFGPEAELVAAIPQYDASANAVSARTAAIFDRLGVRTAPFASPFGRAYPIGNKLACLGMPLRQRVRVFLDTDIFVCRAAGDLPDLAARLSEGPPAVAGVPATHCHVGDAEWTALYRKFGLSDPARTHRNMSARHAHPPYLNAGVVATNAGPRFAEAWQMVTQAMLDDPSLRRSLKHPWADQVALPIAAALSHLELVTLGTDWNFPSWSARARTGSPPVFYHYQVMLRLLRDRPVRTAALDLLRQEPRWVARAFLAEVGDYARSRTKRSWQRLQQRAEPRRAPSGGPQTGS